MCVSNDCIENFVEFGFGFKKPPIRIHVCMNNKAVCFETLKLFHLVRSYANCTHFHSSFSTACAENKFLLVKLMTVEMERVRDRKEFFMQPNPNGLMHQVDP